MTRMRCLVLSFLLLTAPSAGTRLSQKGKVVCPVATPGCHCHCNVPPTVPPLPASLFETPVGSFVEPLPYGLMPPAPTLPPVPPMPPPEAPPLRIPNAPPDLPSAPLRPMPPLPVMSPLSEKDLPTFGPPPPTTMPPVPDGPPAPWTYHSLLHEAMFPTLAPGQAEYEKAKAQRQADLLNASYEAARQAARATATAMADTAMERQVHDWVRTKAKHEGQMKVDMIDAVQKYPALYNAIAAQQRQEDLQRAMHAQYSYQQYAAQSPVAAPGPASAGPWAAYPRNPFYSAPFPGASGAAWQAAAYPGAPWAAPPAWPLGAAAAPPVPATFPALGSPLASPPAAASAPPGVASAQAQAGAAGAVVALAAAGSDAARREVGASATAKDLRGSAASSKAKKVHVQGSLSRNAVKARKPENAEVLGEEESLAPLHTMGDVGKQARSDFQNGQQKVQDGKGTRHLRATQTADKSSPRQAALLQVLEHSQEGQQCDCLS